MLPNGNLSVFICIFTLGVALLSLETEAKRRVRRQMQGCPVGFIPTDNQLRVFLTVSSLANVTDIGRISERQLELNWYNADPRPGDWVGLFTRDPAQDPTTSPLERTDVKTARGYYPTGVTFPRPTFSARSLRSECLGFWVGYMQGARTLASRCIRHRPTWMWDSRHEIGNFRLKDIFIPGTHDSGSYEEYQGRDSENVITRYTMCQDENVWNQLSYGIRYLDFRIGFYDNTPEKFWLNHGTFKVNPLRGAIVDLLAFLNNTNEIVIVDFHRFPVGFNNKERHRELIEYITTELQGHMLPRVAGQEFTLNDIWGLEKRLILAYGDVSYQNSTLLWPTIPQYWGDTNEPNTLKRYLDDTMNIRKNGLWVAMAELTPTTADIIGNPRGSLRILADNVNRNITEWARDSWWDKANVIATDYFHGNDLIEIALEANSKRRQCSDRLSVAPPNSVLRPGTVAGRPPIFFDNNWSASITQQNSNWDGSNSLSVPISNSHQPPGGRPWNFGSDSTPSASSASVLTTQSPTSTSLPPPPSISNFQNTNHNALSSQNNVKPSFNYPTKQPGFQFPPAPPPYPVGTPPVKGYPPPIPTPIVGGRPPHEVFGFNQNLPRVPWGGFPSWGGYPPFQNPYPYWPTPYFGYPYPAGR